MKAMIFAAGLGTRLKPFTLHHPKALAMVNGQSLLERNIKYLQQYGISDVIVNVHHFADQVIQAIHQNKGWGSRVSISDETDAVLETGGGLKKAFPFFEQEENFVVMNADVLTDFPLYQLIQQHLQQQPLATLAVSNRRSSRCFLFDEAGLLQGWRNQQSGEEKGPCTAPNFSKLLAPKAFSGIQIVNSSIQSALNLYEGKFGMVQVYLDAAASSKPIHFFDHSGFRFLDVGKPESIAQAETMFQ